jgi:hypothetical protein
MMPIASFTLHWRLLDNGSVNCQECVPLFLSSPRDTAPAKMLAASAYKTIVEKARYEIVFNIVAEAPPSN